jgi:hypothetical protein
VLCAQLCTQLCTIPVRCLLQQAPNREAQFQTMMLGDGHAGDLQFESRTIVALDCSKKPPDHDGADNLGVVFSAYYYIPACVQTVHTTTTCGCLNWQCRSRR